MNAMKKLISLILALCMACMLIPAMAEEDLTGEWYGTLFGMGIVLTLNADGTYAFMFGGEVQEAGAWKTEDGNVIMEPTESDNPTTVMEIQDEGLYYSEMDMTMTRNPEDAAPAIEIAPAKPAASAEEFYGEWACYAVLLDEGMVVDYETYAEENEDEMPNIIITADSVTFEGEGQVADLFGLLPFTPSFADGILTISAGLEDSGLAFTAETLEDGNIMCTMGPDDSPLVVVYAPADAE